mmetsp:Transcript_18769/g.29563  ORF Transcript_18769/g.29563 Transcript_18769/m.29563 type:complete len:250 (-) Transcript_18769:111-860(-)
MEIQMILKGLGVIVLKLVILFRQIILFRQMCHLLEVVFKQVTIIQPILGPIPGKVGRRQKGCPTWRPEMIWSLIWNYDRSFAIFMLNKVKLRILDSTNQLQELFSKQKYGGPSYVLVEGPARTSDRNSWTYRISRRTNVQGSRGGRHAGPGIIQRAPRDMFSGRTYCRAGPTVCAARRTSDILFLVETPTVPCGRTVQALMCARTAGDCAGLPRFGIRERGWIKGGGGYVCAYKRRQQPKCCDPQSDIE